MNLLQLPADGWGNICPRSSQNPQIMLRTHVGHEVVLVHFDNQVILFIFRFWMGASVQDLEPFAAALPWQEAKSGLAGPEQGPAYRSVVSLCFSVPHRRWALGVNEPVLKMLIFLG